MRLRDVLKIEEGFSGRPYACSAGAQTIGYGRNLDAKPLTRAEGEYLLDNDMREVEADLFALFGEQYGSMQQHRRNALASMRYQLGARGFRRFVKTCAAVKAQDWDTAAREALDSEWAAQTPKRAQRCSDALRTGRDVWKEIS